MNHKAVKFYGVIVPKRVEPHLAQGLWFLYPSTRILNRNENLGVMPIAEKRHRPTDNLFNNRCIASEHVLLMYWPLLEEEAIVFIYHASNLGLYTFLAMRYAYV